ncbi:recombinase family protein [Candidatus Pacebacteria bacterium]|nr:recombinase family protein [Candidatus Paceibacterota bacterium]
MKYILYCRKSSESEDRQVMSLEAQENELRKVAKRDNVEIYKIFHESKSAKAPGRPLFAEMLKLISTGKADGILCWKLDRLARNPIDGGSISWLLQNAQINSIKTYEREYLPSDNVLLMSVEFGMSNQYVRDLSVNVKRGNREKLRRGEWPNHAPYGYRNDKNTKTLELVKKEADNVREIFELYVTGNYSFSQLANMFELRKSNIEKMLNRTFYYGVMERHGEFFPGKHTPIITKELFKKVQDIKDDARVTRCRPQDLFFPFRGFMNCAECGCQITATRKKSKYDYYYCTNGKGFCSQKSTYLKESEAEEFFVDALSKIQFDEELIEIMYQASLEKLKQTDINNEQKLIDTKQELEKIYRQEKKLSQSFTAELIDETLYREEVKRIKSEKETLLAKQSNYTKSNDELLRTLELTKKVFLDSNRALSEFKSSKPEKKRVIAQNLLWNFSVCDKKVLSYKYKSPYNVLAKTPKNSDFATLLLDRDSNPD